MILEKLSITSLFPQFLLSTLDNESKEREGNKLRDSNKVVMRKGTDSNSFIALSIRFLRYGSHWLEVSLSVNQAGAEQKVWEGSRWEQYVDEDAPLFPLDRILFYRSGSQWGISNTHRDVWSVLRSSGRLRSIQSLCIRVGEEDRPWRDPVKVSTGKIRAARSLNKNKRIRRHLIIIVGESTDFAFQMFHFFSLSVNQEPGHIM